MSKTTAEWQEAAAKAAHTGKMANTLAKALAKRYSKRWQFVDFLGPNGRESAGIVDILAIRKSGQPPSIEGLKILDLFDILIIQVKGGSAPKPNDADIKRLKNVGRHYQAQKIVLFQWKKQESEKTGFRVLDERDEWQEISAAQLFGQ